MPRLFSHTGKSVTSTLDHSKKEIPGVQMNKYERQNLKASRRLQEYRDPEVEQGFLNKTQENIISSNHMRKDRFNYNKNSSHQNTS